MERRQTELDILRLLALFWVAALHVSGSVWSGMEPLSDGWLVLTLYRVTWPVPVFTMISGRFFLDPERQVPVRILYIKYIRRIVTALLFWGGVYQIYYLCRGLLAGQAFAALWKGCVAGIFTGAYHQWYLWMLLGLYAVTPLLRKIAEDRHLTAYYLGLYVLVQCLHSFAAALPLVGGTVTVILSKAQMTFVMGFAGYYLMGYALHRWQPEAWQEGLLYGLGLLSGVVSPLGNVLLAQVTGKATDFFTAYHTPTVMVQAAAVYLFFVKRVSRLRWGEGIRKRIAFLAEHSFGAYLIHALVNEFVTGETGRALLLAHPVAMLPALTLVVLGISFLLSAAIRKTKLGRYIL